MKTRKRKNRTTPWAPDVIPALLGFALLAGICCFLYFGFSNYFQAHAQRDAWMMEYERHGSPLVVQVPAKGLNWCHGLLLEMRSVGFSIEIDGREMADGNDMMSACRWFEGSPTLKLHKP